MMYVHECVYLLQCSYWSQNTTLGCIIHFVLCFRQDTVFLIVHARLVGMQTSREPHYSCTILQWKCWGCTAMSSFMWASVFWIEFLSNYTASSLTFEAFSSHRRAFLVISINYSFKVFFCYYYWCCYYSLTLLHNLLFIYLFSVCMHVFSFAFLCI